MGGFFSSKLLLLVIVQICTCSSLESPSCNTTEIELLSKAFAYVSGFRPSPLLQNCSAAADIRLSSRNLKGTISWKFLREISRLRVLDLSGNSLSGSIPTNFWSAPNLIELNLAGNRFGGPVGGGEFPGSPPSSLHFLNLSSNRFTNSIQLSGFPSLRFLDLSQNDLRTWPSGLPGLTQLKHLDLSFCNISGEGKILAGISSLEYLDISQNRIMGSFPENLPQIARIRFLNISFNDFTGNVAAKELRRFGSSAFLRAGVGVLSDNYDTSASSSSPVPEEHRKPRELSLVWGTCLSAGFLSIFALVMVATWLRRKGCSAASAEKSKEGSLAAGEAAAPPWVAEIIAGGSIVAAAPVVMFEKPLLQLTFVDLMAATSGFGEESKLADSRNGAVYRAVLPGDIDVVVKVINCLQTADNATFEELRHLKHPNVLPLLGFCIAGRGKLLLYEYMENGDLRRWLQELPIYSNEEKLGEDDWENPKEERENTTMGWETRHKIALGIARGLAFLHHGRSKPFVHGNLVLSNVLFDEDFEPRIAGIGTGGAGADGGATEADVYSYGLVLVELLTGKEAAPQMMAAVRRLVRGERAEGCLDRRLRLHAGGSNGEKAEEEMVETLRLALLCAAEKPEKRPSMKQVVGLIKDIRRPYCLS